MQAVAPASLAEPGAQVVQTAEPCTALKVPEAQVVQPPAAVVPEVPTSQNAQLPAPASAVVPTGQSLQTTAPTVALNRLGAHAVQGALPVAEKKPG